MKPVQQPASPTVPDAAPGAHPAAPGVATEPAAKEKAADKPDDVEAGPAPTYTLAERKARAKQRRAERKVTSQLRWTTSDDAMLPYIGLRPSEVNLHLAKTVSELAMVETVCGLWEYLEAQNIFLPGNEHATWANMPDEAKVFAFLAMKERAIPWDIRQFNEKAQARLCKLRAQTGHKAHREDPMHVRSVNTHPSHLWTAYRLLDSDEEPIEVQMAHKLSTAEAEILHLKSQLTASVAHIAKGKLFDCTPIVNDCS
jgi:hypothetical protein